MTHPRTISSYLRVWLFLVIATCGCVFVGCEESDADQAPERGRSDGVVLKEFSTGPDSELRYQLHIGACSDFEWPMQVRLVGKNGVIDETSLDWSLTSADVVEDSLDATFGVGDPLRIPAGSTAWTAGEGDGTVSTFAQTVRLTAELNGLLVHQVGGFEHVKRGHYLFVVDEGRITCPWTGTEGTGPWSSAVVVVDKDEGSGQDIVYFSWFTYPTGDDYDWLEVTRLAWSVRDSTLTSQPADGIHAVVFGPFADAGKARRTLTENWSCFSTFSVLPSERFRALVPGNAVLAAVTTDKSYAVTTLRRTQACFPALTGRVYELQAESNQE